MLTIKAYIATYFIYTIYLNNYNKKLLPIYGIPKKQRKKNVSLKLIKNSKHFVFIIEGNGKIFG